MNLTLEQQFKLKVLKEQVKGLSKEKAQEYLIEMFRQKFIQENLTKKLLREGL